MPEDYYGDGGDAPMGGAAPDDAGGESTDTGVTAVVPSELCPGMKVGDQMMVKIIGVDDDSYEISYVKDKGEPDADEQAAAPAPEGSMASMME